jgi:hypothetical protein
MNTNAKFLNEAAELEARWSRTGLLNDIPDSHTRKVTATMLENQRLCNEQSTDTSDVAQFKRITIPLVRRIYPQLIANKLVSVQPLLGPAGLVYYLRYRMSSNKGATRGADNNAGFPGDDVNSLQQRADGTANLDPYYSHQGVQNESTSIDAGSDVNSVFAPLENTPVIPGTVTGTVYVGSTAVQTLFISSTGVVTLTAIGTPTVYAATTGGGASGTAVAGTTLNNSTGELKVVFNSAPSANHVVLSYEVNMENNQNIPEINLAIEAEPITVISRKLKAVWSMEVGQDLRSQHSLDVEKELTGVLAQEINLEIDREILNDLRQTAGTVTAWDYNAAPGDTIKEKYETLFVKIVQASAVIHRKTLRGGANWIVTTPEIAAIFETATAGFAPTPGEGFTASLGVQYVGSVNNRWRIYKDPTAPDNQILMGYKGDNYMDSGYFYCPYIPLVQTPTLYDPDSFQPRKGIMTRYGKKMLREGAKFYARISVANYII